VEQVFEHEEAVVGKLQRINCIYILQLLGCILILQLLGCILILQSIIVWNIRFCVIP